jgi:alkylation response protein AidB-like acyl-CoA dehydrogenase
VLGPVNEGWRVANTTLSHERGTSATSSHWRFLREWEDGVAIARARGVGGDPLVRQRLAAAYATVHVLRVNGLRLVSKVLRNREDAETAALGAITKLQWTEYHQAFTDFLVTLQGPEGLVLTGTPEDEVLDGVGRGRGSDRYPVSPRQADWFFARSETIWGGTSQIQRNIVAERVLGLPREPKP